MTEPFTLTDELRKSLIGREGPGSSATVEAGRIQRFAEAIEDANPLWNDQVQARRSRYGGIVAPPTFLRTISAAVPSVPELSALTRVLDGGSEWNYFEPVRPGDTITAVSRIMNLAQRTLRIGPAVFATVEVTYTNQYDQKVATQRSTLIRY